MNKGIMGLAVTVLGVALTGWLMPAPAVAQQRVEEATVLGKDKSAQAGQVPSDTRAAPAESKLKKEEAPTGLKSGAPGVRAPEKMEKPKMAEPERKKPEQKRFGNTPVWIWILLVGIIAAAA